MEKTSESMSYGPQSNLVDEVFEFARSGSILRSGGSAPKNATVIQSIADAFRYAWDELYGKDELTWSDIRSQQMSEVWELIYSSSNFGPIHELLSSQLDSMSKIVNAQLESQHKELLDDIVTDLYACLYARAILGNRHQFFETLFEVYRCGAWPCGWDGDFPKGQLVVFVPPGT